MNFHRSRDRACRLSRSESGACGTVSGIAKRHTGRRNELVLRGSSVASGGGISPFLALPALLALAPWVHAGPSGGKVASGAGSISQSATTTTINQTSQNLSINWQSFNIAPQETVDFVQPSTTAIAVNRILGSNGSQILGHLDANGQVYLINPNGIVFGEGAQVNVGGLVASTLALTESSSGGDTRSFAGSGTGGIVNEGTISATNGGYVALLSNHVTNSGVVTAQLGTVALGAGSAVTLTFSGDRLMHLQVDQSVLRGLVQNGGLIRADGGQVLLTAGAKAAVLASMVNNTGVIEARTVENHEGTITLLGGMAAGTVDVAGTLDASAAAGGDGGQIETSAAHVEIAADARVSTLASAGRYGTWLIDPNDFTVAASGGDLTGAALSSNLATTPVVLQSSNGGKAGSGNVNINDAVSWSANTTLTLTASNNVNVNAPITASGAVAGISINPNTANGADPASGTGTLNVHAPINLPNVSPASNSALVINGVSYTVLNSLGASGSTTGADLQGIEGNLSGHYALGTNLDASSTAGWNGGAGFTPIGNPTTGFTGTLDGLGHTVSNLNFNQTTTDYVGLFGYTESTAVIRNLGLIGGSVSGHNFVGALVGWNGGSLNDDYSTGSVSGTTDIGGLVGWNNGIVNASHSTGGVSGAFFVGGLVGDNESAVSSSFATGSVTGGDYFGGLVGANDGGVSNSFATGSVNGTGGSLVGGLVGDNEGAISTSYATGSVSGSDRVGGLVGVNDGGIIDSYATGNAGAHTNVGGLVGLNGTGAAISTTYATGVVYGYNAVGYAGGLVGNNDGGAVRTSFWNTESNPTLAGIGFGATAGATGMTGAQMQMGANFTSATAANGNVNPGWDFSNTWVIYDGYTYPLLRSSMIASETWTGPKSGGLWSSPSNWSLRVVPNDANVLSVAIPTGDTVTYDSGMGSLGPTLLTGLAATSGTFNLVMDAGTLDDTGNLSAGRFTQAGGLLEVGGKLTIASHTGEVTLGNITAGSLSVISKGGAITELAGTAMDVTGTSTLTADNGVSGAGDVKYGITVTDTGNNFVGAVSANGSAIDLVDGTGGIILGNTTASGTLTVDSLGGNIREAAGKSITVSGSSDLTADNGVIGRGNIDYALTLGSETNHLAGAVTADGRAITLTDDTALTANLTSTGEVKLIAAGAINVAGSIATNLTTTTTGTGSATTFGTTTVGKKLTITSAGAVSTLDSSTLTVNNKATTTRNGNVTVNGVKDVAIPLQ